MSKNELDPNGMYLVSKDNGTGDDVVRIGIFRGHLLDIIIALSGNWLLHIRKWKPDELPVANTDERRGSVMLNIDIGLPDQWMKPKKVEEFLGWDRDVDFEVVPEHTGWGHFNVVFPKVKERNERIAALQKQIEEIKNEGIAAK